MFETCMDMIEVHAAPPEISSFLPVPNREALIDVNSAG